MCVCVCVPIYGADQRMGTPVESGDHAIARRPSGRHKSGHNAITWSEFEAEPYREWHASVMDDMEYRYLVSLFAQIKEDCVKEFGELGKVVPPASSGNLKIKRKKHKLNNSHALESIRPVHGWRASGTLCDCNARRDVCWDCLQLEIRQSVATLCTLQSVSIAPLHCCELLRMQTTFARIVE